MKPTAKRPRGRPPLPREQRLGTLALTGVPLPILDAMRADAELRRRACAAALRALARTVRV